MNWIYSCLCSLSAAQQKHTEIVTEDFYMNICVN